MKSTLVMKDLVAAKELGVAEMSGIRGGMNALVRIDEFCGTRIPKPCIPPPWPWPGPTFPTGPIIFGPMGRGLPL